MAETWIINETPTLQNITAVAINFTSAQIRSLGPNYDHFSITTSAGIRYGVTAAGDATTQYGVAYKSSWASQECRTVVFETSPTGDLLTWLQANATQPQPSIHERIQAIKTATDALIPASDKSQIKEVNGITATTTFTPDSGYNYIHALFIKDENNERVFTRQEKINVIKQELSSRPLPLTPQEKVENYNSATGNIIVPDSGYSVMSSVQAKIQLPVDYLCFTAQQNNCTISISGPSITAYYSFDKNTWTPFVANSTVITLQNLQDKVYLKGTNNTLVGSNFQINGYVEASGSIMTLLDETDELRSLSGRDQCFIRLFENCQYLVSAPKLPATTLSQACYMDMFKNCYSLTTVPKLPATQLPYGCYDGMFEECNSLNVYSTSGSGHDKAWRIPTSGTATGYTEWEKTFYHCNGDYGAAGTGYANTTYYTQNEPV